MDNTTRLAWIDLEMTGLDVEKDRIIEMAAIVTEADLTVVAVSEIIVVHQSDELLNSMDEWNTRTHGQSGLTERVRASRTTEAEAEARMMSFLLQHVPKGVSPMCGNSIGQDRRFLSRYMPDLEAHFHYRNIDVSTLKELARRWAPSVPAFEKKGAHRALDDIEESIGELAYFRRTIMSI